MYRYMIQIFSSDILVYFQLTLKQNKSESLVVLVLWIHYSATVAISELCRDTYYCVENTTEEVPVQLNDLI